MIIPLLTFNKGVNIYYFSLKILLNLKIIIDSNKMIANKILNNLFVFRQKPTMLRKVQNIYFHITFFQINV